MKSSKWNQLISKHDIGVAILKVQFQALDIFDFSFSEINETMLSFFGTNKKTLLRKKGSDIFRDDLEEWNLWKEFCEVVNSSNQKQFEGFSSFFKTNYLVKTMSIEKNKVVVLFQKASAKNQNVFLFENDQSQELEMTWIVNNDYQIIYASSGVLPMLGYQTEEIKQKSIFNLISLSSIDVFMKLFEDEIHTDGLSSHPSLEIQMIRKDQIPLVTTHQVHYLHDSEGKPSAILSLVKTVNNQFYSKKQKINQEQYLKTILNATAEAIYVINEEGTIKFCNESCIKMLGYQNGNELIGKNSHLLFHHHNSFNQIIPVEDCEVYHIFKTGKGVYSDKEVFWKKDHTNFSVEYYAYPIYFQDHIEDAVVTFFDITNRKNIERQLKESVRSHSVLLANLPGMAYKCNFD
ncbi:MAG: PAS domain-containing protein, partial [Bacilli bacterium]